MHPCPPAIVGFVSQKFPGHPGLSKRSSGIILWIAIPPAFPGRSRFATYNRGRHYLVHRLRQFFTHSSLPLPQNTLLSHKMNSPSDDARSSTEYDESEFILGKHSEKKRPRRWISRLPSPWVFSTFLFAALSMVLAFRGPTSAVGKTYETGFSTDLGKRYCKIFPIFCSDHVRNRDTSI